MLIWQEPNEEKIKDSIDFLINNTGQRHSSSIYGDGTASIQIATIIKAKFYKSEA